MVHFCTHIYTIVLNLFSYTLLTGEGDGGGEGRGSGCCIFYLYGIEKESVIFLFLFLLLFSYGGWWVGQIGWYIFLHGGGISFYIC